jgi:hypothetical protein
MTAGIKANSDGSAAIQVGGSDAITITSGLAVSMNGGAVYPLTSGTAVTASGTSIDFTGIPSTAKRITVMFSGVSTNGTSPIQIQLGNGSFVTSGYFGSTYYHNTGGISAAGATTGLIICQNIATAQSYSGIATLTLVTGNSWVGNAAIESNNGLGGGGSSSITLGSALDRVRITTVNGTDTFDAGTINILWE